MISPRASRRLQIKKLIVEALALEGMEPGEIGDEDPLFNDGLGLDSVDALELVVVFEKHFDIRIDGQAINPEDFATVSSIARMIDNLTSEGESAAS